MKFQQQGCRDELVQNRWIEQSAYEVSSLPEQRQNAGFEVFYSRFEVQGTEDRVSSVERTVTSLEQGSDLACPEYFEIHMFLETPFLRLGFRYLNHCRREIYTDDMESLLGQQECLDPCVAPDVEEEAAGGCQGFDCPNREL